MTAYTENDPSYLMEFRLGGQLAFKTFFQSYFTFWTSHADARLENILHSEEVALEAFAGIWDKKDVFESIDNACVYVITRIDRACNDYEILVMEEAKRILIKIPGNSKLKKFHRYNSRKHTRILKANEKYVSYLPKFERICFILHYCVNVDSDKIAYLLGTDRLDIKTQIKRSNNLLKEFRIESRIESDGLQQIPVPGNFPQKQNREYE